MIMCPIERRGVVAECLTSLTLGPTASYHLAHPRIPIGRILEMIELIHRLVLGELAAHDVHLLHPVPGIDDEVGVLRLL